MEGTIALPKNAALERNIRQAALRDALPHGVILSGGGDLAPSAQFLAAAMQCAESRPPCGVCSHCKKVLRGIHPDVITVEDNEHKSIATEVLRQVRSDAYVLPNEGRRKIYLFPDSSRLDGRSQNVLLKVLEEGPPHAAFIFCAENSSVLLPTIRSRCVEWRLGTQTPSHSPAGEAEQLANLLAAGDKAGVAAFFCRLERRKPEREELRQLLSALRDLLAAALTGRQEGNRLCGAFSLSGLSYFLEQMGKLTKQCDFNINIGQLSGAAMVVCHQFLEAESKKKGGVCP